MTPALRAIREHYPGSALHVLVAEEVVPLLQHLPGLARVWAFPRRRGKAKPTLSWPVIRALRRERFDRSVDFGGNDRGAIVSLLCGARQRLGPLWPDGFLCRRFCYTHARRLHAGGHQSFTNFQLLSAWSIAAPDCPRLEIYPDPAAGRRCRTIPATPGHPLPPGYQPAEERMAAGELGRALPPCRRCRAGTRVLDRRHPSGAGAAGRLEAAAPGRARAPRAPGLADLPGGAEAGAIVYQRGHRASAFCRGAWGADHWFVRSLSRPGSGRRWATSTARCRPITALAAAIPPFASARLPVWRRFRPRRSCVCCWRLLSDRSLTVQTGLFTSSALFPSSFTIEP